MDVTSTRRRAVLGASVGTLLEYYDYYLFGLAAAVVFPKTFFPSDDPVASELASFAAFAVGFVLRPLGGIVLGHIADRAGRKTALIITIVSMGIATMLIGVLPGYDRIGVAAPICLVVLRLVQGFATGGEMGSATSLATEHAPPRRRGLYGALLLSGSGVALFLSSGLMDLVSLLPQGEFLSWGWRIPFLLSVVLLVAGLVIRWKVPETPEFERAKEKRSRRAPLLVVLRRPKMLVFGVLFGFANSIGGYVVTTYGTAYLTGRGVSASVAYTATMVAAGVQIVLAPTWGALSDRIGRRPVFLGGCVALAVVIFPVFWLYDTENAVLTAVAMVLGFPVAVLAMSALSQTILSELFGTEARATGISMGYQLTAVLAGGFAPAISTALVAAGGGQAWGVCLYVIGACVLSGLSMLMLPDRAGEKLEAS